MIQLDDVMTMKYSRPRGTQDILPPEIHTWRHVEGVFEATLERFGYEPVRTPIFESTDLFVRSVGEGTDIVSKEMYTFSDRRGRSLTLRPENTASAIRAFLESGLHRRGGIVRLYYIGPMFRYDRPQAGRYRQFHQVGAEAIGTLNPALDAEIIDIVVTALEGVGFQELAVEINSVGCKVCRSPYTAVLRKALEGEAGRLCADCRERTTTNPLRVFDCKTCVEVKTDLPRISDHLCEECANHFDRVKDHLRSMDRRFDHNPQLVRGLDYYTKTTFEVLHEKLGAQNALCGGGRYDDLVEECGGPPTPAVGFSAGLERIISVLPSKATQPPASGAHVYVACADEAATTRALQAARILRKYSRVELDASMRALKTQLRGAEKRGASVTVIVDSESPGVLKWKNMQTREQLDIEEDYLDEFARTSLGPGGSES